MDIPISIGLSEENKKELASILGCSDEELVQQLSRYGSASLSEYVTMILGLKVFRRGSDIMDYRLFLLIENAFEGQIPDEQVVSNLFQTTSTESRSLIRSVMSKYQYQLKTAKERSIINILKSAKKDDVEDHYVVIVNNLNLIAEMNNAIANIDGSLPPIEKNHDGISTWLIKSSSYNHLKGRYIKVALWSLVP
jgi:hypothetical protein